MLSLVLLFVCVSLAEVKLSYENWHRDLLPHLPVSFSEKCNMTLEKYRPLDWSELSKEAQASMVRCFMKEAMTSESSDPLDCRSRLKMLWDETDPISKSYVEDCVGKFIAGSYLHHTMRIFPEDIFTNKQRLNMLMAEWSGWLPSYMQFASDRMLNASQAIPSSYRQWWEELGLGTSHYDKPWTKMPRLFDYIVMNEVSYDHAFPGCDQDDCLYVFFDAVADFFAAVDKATLSDVGSLFAKFQ